MTKREVGLSTKVITISSGKGGVGKTNVVVNLAVSLARLGKKVVVLDADLGLGNIDVLLGLAPRYNLGHFLRGEKLLEEIMTEGPCGIRIIPAASGLEELTRLTLEHKLLLISNLENLNEKADYLLIDNAAGISENVLFFSIAASEIIVVASPDPTSIVDAYAFIKVLNLKYGEKRFRLLVNMAKTAEEGLGVYKNISLVAGRYLNISLDYLGHIAYDEKVRRAVREQKPVCELYTTSAAKQGFLELARNVCEFPPTETKENIHILMNAGPTDNLAIV
ncbi:MAG: MinD/ParA family protein [Deltaproteobacteria bacterium]|nr:MinD/ParA family protein [Deltaproteobacteria bacterium]